MTVYVDDMYRRPLGHYGRLRMSHMIADTTDELMAMADKIGLDRRYIQKRGTSFEHFDVGMGLRAKAIKEGAVAITMRELAAKCCARQAAQMS